METRLRLAPSPTGPLHIGTARTALFNWLYARSTKGKFLIRIEDTDKLRSKSEYTNNILEGLRWLGLDWDEEPINQSERVECHKEYIQKLIDKGLAYRCFASEEDILSLREHQKLKGLPPRHDNRHRNLSPKKIDEFISEGRSSVIRFKIEDDEVIRWEDLIRGEIKWLGKDLGGDIVLSRRSIGYEIGEPLYNLAVVIDDNFMKITHVVRGEDHISNTAKQILIYKALNFKLPIFSHTPLILNKEGKKLSKRDSVTSIKDFKEMGYLPNALANYMALLGWSIDKEENEIQTIEEVSKDFNLRDINKAGAKFNWEKLNWINSQYIKKINDNDLHLIFKNHWRNMGWEEKSNEWGLKLTILLKDSLTVLTDIEQQSDPFFREPQIKEEAIDFLQKEEVIFSLNKILEIVSKIEKDINNDLAREIINNISKEHKIKKGILMKSLRAAFFGSLCGPDLIESWVLFSEIKEDIKRIKKSLNII